MLFAIRYYTNVIFFKGTTKEVYRKCDISHLRYLKERKKIKQRPGAHFHSTATAKQHRSEKTEERKTAGAIWVLPFRGRGRVRGGAKVYCSNGRYLC